MKIILNLLLFFSLSIKAQVGIGTSNPNSSSSLDIVSSDKGILIPRLTVAQRIAILNPADGLLVYQTNDVSGFYFFNGTDWNKLLDKKKDGNPTGTIISFSTSDVPTNYLECNGAAISRITYAELFAVIGTNYGNGNGTTTFNLPDYRGQFLRGYSHGTNTDPDRLTRTDRGDGTTGDVVGSKQNNKALRHNHLINPPATNSNTTGNHRHVINPPNTFTTFSGNHNHLVDPPNTNTATGGNHRHTTSYRGRNTNYPNQASSRTVYTSSRRWSNPVNNTGLAGNHRHTVNIAPFNSYTSGNHRHTVDITPFNSTTIGNHSHTTDIAPFNSANVGGNETRPKNISVMYCIKY
jgi:microcystin-dependent protein